MIDTLIKNNTHCFFVSPHLDDAAFSAGGLLVKLSGKVPITIANVFTQAGDNKNTISAKVYLKQCGYNDGEQLFKDRLEEDKAALSSTTSSIVNFGFTDALWRKKSSSLFQIPELTRVYPTYRWHISRGRISRHDQQLFEKLQQTLKKLVKTQNYMIFCPAGFGRHVDHLLVRNACEQVFSPDKIYYWSDFPYFFRDNTSDNFINKKHLDKEIVSPSYTQKRQLCSLYKSQFKAVITDVKSLKQSEVYYHSSATVHRDSHFKRIARHISTAIRFPKEFIFSFTYPTNEYIRIKKFDPKVRTLARMVGEKISKAHVSLKPVVIGSTGLGVSGQGDIDMIVPINKADFRKYKPYIENIYGKSTSENNHMVQWKLTIEGISVDLDLIDADSHRYSEQLRLFNLLHTNKEALKEYDQFKWRMNGKSVRRYAREQIYFFDYILQKYSVDNFVLVRPLLQNKQSKIYSYGLYQDQKGTQAFVKMWQGSRKNSSYYALKNEMAAYQLLQKVAIKGVKIPKVLHAHVSSNRLALCLEPISGSNPSTFLLDKKLKIYTTVLSSLESASQSMSMSNTIGTRSKWYWLTLLPLITLGAITRHPSMMKKIIKSIATFATRVGSFITDDRIGYTHRDIGNWNILVDKKTIWLFDLQLASKAHPYIDTVVFMLKVWGDAKLMKAFLATPRMKTIIQSERQWAILRSYGIIFALYDLALVDGGDPKLANDFLEHMS